MAAIAAYFAFRTYRSAQEDVARLEQRAAEPSFLNLLERRYDVLDRVFISRTRFRPTTGADTQEWQGQGALNRIATTIRRQGEHEKQPLSNLYLNAVKGASGLSNLFRFTYHIVAYADRQFSKIPTSEPMTKADSAYQYVRLLRAQMSDAELLLMALNCAFGPGHDKFKPLVERYALLHNINQSDMAQFGLTDLFAATAFGLELKDRVRNDAPLPIEAELEDALDI